MHNIDFRKHPYGFIAGTVFASTVYTILTFHRFLTAPLFKLLPKRVNEGCPGTQSENAGRSDSCEGCPNQSNCVEGKVDPVIEQIAERFQNVKKVILVCSGKGGVGKSTVSTNLARLMAERYPNGCVGLLDIDICGPSVPRMLNVMKDEVHQSADGWNPIFVKPSLCVMSIGFLLPNEDDAVIWRGARKNGLIQTFLADVNWGELDCLIIDSPPGTSDEHLSLVNYLSKAGIDGTILVTTPQEVALQDVRKELSFCRKTNIPVLGIIENMKGLECKFCHGWNDVFPTSPILSTKMYCEQEKIPYLGSIPINSHIATMGDSGEGYGSEGLNAPLKKIIDVIESL